MKKLAISIGLVAIASAGLCQMMAVPSRGNKPRAVQRVR